MNKPRISTSWMILLLVPAIAIDVIQAILEWVTAGISDVWDDLVLDPMILFGYWLVFYFFLKVNFTRTRAFVFIFIGLLEFVPIVKEFPLWTADILAVILMTRAEDKIPLLKKLDGANLKNPAQLKEGLEKAGMTTENINSLKSVGRGIMNSYSAISKSNTIPEAVSRRQARQKQIFDNGAEQVANQREQIIAAQKASKTNNEQTL